MIYVKNQTTNEVAQLYNLNKSKFNEREVISRYPLREKRINELSMWLKFIETREKYTLFALHEGVVFISSSEYSEYEKLNNEPKDTDTDTDNETEAEVVETVEVEETPTPTPAPTPTPTFEAGGLEGGLAAVFAPVFNNVASQIEASIRAKVDKEIKELKTIAEEKARRIEIVLPDGRETEVTGATIPEFDDILQDVSEGINVYMYGPAGSGKSHTAKQIAEALGLPFYETNQLEFAHEVTGYGDASGRYVPTPFYEAVVNGGLFFFDEFDRSSQQVTTVINTVLANRRYTFPVIGNVEAHPNFRCIAAGNTAMCGADMEYTAAQLIDASSRDRFVFYEIGYSRQVELPIHAQNDERLYAFMDALRKAIEKTNIQLLASPRSTAYLKRREANKAKALKHGLIKGAINKDDVRNLYENMEVHNEWTDALLELTK
jgi:hypothetical protein